MLLWASSKRPGLLTADQQHVIIAAADEKQQADGGWTMATLASWKRVDNTALDTASDGYATGLIPLVQVTVGGPATDAHVRRGVPSPSRHPRSPSQTSPQFGRPLLARRRRHHRFATPRP